MIDVTGVMVLTKFAGFRRNYFLPLSMLGSKTSECGSVSVSLLFGFVHS